MDLKDILNRDSSGLHSKVMSLVKRPMSSKNGYLSDIHFLTLNLDGGDELHMVSKSPLQSIEGDENQVYLTISKTVNESEIKFYSTVYPELKKEMEDLQLPYPIPTCFYVGDSLDGPVLILEDLTFRNVKAPSLETDLSDAQLTIIVKALAAVQVCAVSLQVKKETSILELFPFLKNPFNILIQDLVESRIELFFQYFNAQFPNASNLVQHLSAIISDVILNDYFFYGKDADYFLCHGDLWNNNVFLNADDCFLIDWQGVSSGCPNGDIAVLVLSGCDLGPNPVARFEAIVRSYVDSLLEYCGERIALRRFLEQKLIPALLSDKMIKKSIQFGAKWIVGSWDCFVDSTAAVRLRVLRNIHNLMMEISP